MLLLLHIENIAVIQSADIQFDGGFNVLTGETGAGKSIVVDALGAVLGGRTSRELIRTGADKAAIADHVTRYYPLGFTLDEIRDAYQFDVSCAGSVPQAMEAFLEAESFEDAVRNAISIGGDSDTIACMAGSVAAAFFGIPKDIREAAQPFLEGEVKRVYQAFIQRY